MQVGSGRTKKCNTHNFFLHSVARSILNSGRLTKPSAFSSCETGKATNADEPRRSFTPILVYFPPFYSGHAVAQIARSHLLVPVPVQTAALQNEPVLLPPLGEIRFSVLLLPQPALAVPLAQVLAGDASLADQGQRVLGHRERWKGGHSNVWVLFFLFFLPD